MATSGEKPINPERPLVSGEGVRLTTEGLGPVVVHDFTMRAAEALKTALPGPLTERPASEIFDEYLKSSVGSATSVAQRQLASAELDRLTDLDRTAIARAALTLDDPSHDALSHALADPIKALTQTLTDQISDIDKQRTRVLNSFKRLAPSPSALSLLNEGFAQSQILKATLDPYATVAQQLHREGAAERAANPAYALGATQRAFESSVISRMRDHLQSPYESAERDRQLELPSIPDSGKPQREHQAKVEAAGARVVELSELVAQRINNLVDFAQLFQAQANASGRKSFFWALIALSISTILTLASLSYQIWKDHNDASMQREEIQLLRAMVADHRSPPSPSRHSVMTAVTPAVAPNESTAGPPSPAPIPSGR